ncbi:MAG: NfeD family protein [Verrucomicrobiales bacterium]|jgi:membrane-bound serine protease (ClpP class)|nr:NfeD family protein [Verrucomicrobiales bacterium]
MTLIISLILAALLLFTAEIFLPGLIAGALGALCLIGSVIAAGCEYGAGTGALLLTAEVAGCAALFMCWMKFFPDSPLGKKFSLHQPPPQTSVPAHHAALLNADGETITPLRPAGAATISGRRHDVIAEGQFIPANTHIKVVKLEGACIVVRKI